MHIIARIVKILFYIPIIILVFPALLMLTIAVFVVETEEGPLRTFFLNDVNRLGFRKGFSLFMRENFIKSYRYNIQGFVIGGAGFLVVAVGLRSLGVLPTDIVYLALGLEFFLLLIYAVAMFYSTDFTEKNDSAEEKLASMQEQFNKTLSSLNLRIEQLGAHVQRTEARMSTPEFREMNEKFIHSTKDLSGHLALLESRLRLTEEKFDNLTKLNASMDNLAQHLDLIVADHLNSRVRREFESLLLQITQRATTR